MKSSLIEQLTKNQAILYEALVKGAQTVTICTGPAGTGKTHVSLGAAAHVSSKANLKVLFTRPTVVAGPALGHLPGTLDKKMSPFVDHILSDNKAVLPKTMEVATLQHMRGRTLKDMFVVADEIQNATIEETKMLLTRIGKNTRVVLCGDEEQSDLPGDRENGLAYIKRAVKNAEAKGYLKHVRLVELTHEDIMRSEAIREILSICYHTSPR